MPLKITKWKGSPFLYIRGTVAGQYVCESTKTSDRLQAEAYRIKREREVWDDRQLGVRQAATFAEAVIAYTEHGGETRFALRLLDHFAEMPLSAIGQSEIDHAAVVLYPEAKAATRARQVYGPMIAILRHAARSRLLGAALPLIETPRIAKVAANYGSDEQVDAILAQCAPPLRALCLVMTYTGLRIGEILRLRRPDFFVRKGWVRVAKTKNGEPAMVPLTEEAHVAAIGVLPDGLQPAFGYRSGQGVNKALKRAAKAAGVAPLSCHEIGRHTFSARMLAAGYDIKTVKEAGRWKKLSVVDERYGHLEQRQAHEAMLSVGNRTNPAKRQAVDHLDLMKKTQ